MFVFLNIALCAVLCAHATRSALRSEEKTLSLLEKEKEDFVSISHFVSLKTERKARKKDMKKRQERKKSSFLVVFFALFSSLSKSVSFCSQNDLLVVKSNN